MRRRRSHWPLVAGGSVVIAAALAIGLVEHYGFPRGSVWVVVGVAVLLLLLVRAVGRDQ
jgi:hypothetical protein